MRSFKLSRVIRVIVLTIICFLGGDMPVMQALADSGPDLHCTNPKPTLKVIALGDSRTPYHPIKMRLLEQVIFEKPDLFIHLGDMVADTRDKHWQRFDLEEGMVRQMGIPFLPVVGNHEHRGIMYRGTPLKPLYDRFPELQKSRWYRYLCGPLEVIAIDSEDPFMPKSRQRVWLKNHLTKPAQGRMRMVVMHRPPITGRRNYSHPAKEALFKLLQPAPDYGGVPLVLASHVHNYERFQRDATMLVVSGGGGATAYKFKRRKDDLYKKRTFPNFHYMRMTIRTDAIESEMVRLDPKSAQSKVMDRFTIHPPMATPPIFKEDTKGPFPRPDAS